MLERPDHVLGLPENSLTVFKVTRFNFESLESFRNRFHQESLDNGEATSGRFVGIFSAGEQRFMVDMALG